MTTPSQDSYDQSPVNPPTPSPPLPYAAAIYFIISLVLFVAIMVAVLKLAQWHRRTRFSEMWPDAVLDEEGDIVATDQTIVLPANDVTTD
jgi:hypothetical protein